LLGSVEQKDHFQNKKYQIAYVAGNKFYVIERL
jgi:hypothetical protein